MKTANPGILKHLFWLWILSALLLSACGNRFEDQLRENYKIVQTNLGYLKKQLDTKQLSNALLIEKYATALAQLKPGYNDIAKLMKKEATSQGKAYTALSKRLAAVKLSPTNTEQASASLQELQLINSAADVFEFNNSLADVVNTLASLSAGKLPLINVPASQKASAQQANALIGNPSYGNWRQDNNGRSFWEWYGMYSLFSNVFGRHTYYDSWSSRPHYSYYNNYGRNRWGSSTDINRNHNLSRRYPSRYNKPSAAARTRYSTSASRSSSYFGANRSSSSSRYSAYGSSSRSSSFTSSRGFRGGK